MIPWEHNCKTCLYNTEPKAKACEECRRDLVEVVRCKDCKWHEEIYGWYRCLWWHNVTEPEVFCSMGERREDEESDSG